MGECLRADYTIGTGWVWQGSTAEKPAGAMPAGTQRGFGATAADHTGEVLLSNGAKRRMTIPALCGVGGRWNTFDNGRGLPYGSLRRKPKP
jgi:hypothetical protein